MLRGFGNKSCYQNSLATTFQYKYLFGCFVRFALHLLLFNIIRFFVCLSGSLFVYNNFSACKIDTVYGFLCVCVYFCVKGSRFCSSSKLINYDDF